MTEETILVSIMLVNNEIGAVEDVKTLSEIVHSYNPKILFHVDAIQAYGKYHTVPKRLGIDLMSVSGHKLHGPKGVGFLLHARQSESSSAHLRWWSAKGISFRYGKCSGDCRLGCGSRAVLQKQINLCGTDVCLQETFDRGTGSTRRCDGQWLVSGLPLEETAPHIVSASFAGVRSEVLLHALAEKGVFVSSGSACSSNHPELSGTLKAIGVADELLDSTLRFSLSTDTTIEQIDYALEQLYNLLPMLRRFIRK